MRRKQLIQYPFTIKNKKPLSAIRLGGSILNLIKDTNQKVTANVLEAFL